MFTLEETSWPKGLSRATTSSNSWSDDGALQKKRLTRSPARLPPSGRRAAGYSAVRRPRAMTAYPQKTRECGLAGRQPNVAAASKRFAGVKGDLDHLGP